MTNEEFCLAIKSGSGNRSELLGELYNQNSGMIERTIRRYAGVEDLDDLRQEAFFGIAAAADLWDPDKDAAFITYALYWIRQVIHRYIENCGGVIRVPVHQRQRIRTYDRAVNNYRLRFGRDPSDLELTFALNISQEQLNDLRKDKAALYVRSTSEPIGGEDSDGYTIEDTIPDASDPIQDLIEELQRAELKAAIWAEVDRLPQKQAAVIRARFQEDKTLKECAADLGYSVEYIRSLQEKGLRALRHSKSTKVILPYLTESGAYNMGIRNNGLGAFRRSGSAQERAVILMELETGRRLWDGQRLNEG